MKLKTLQDAQAIQRDIKLLALRIFKLDFAGATLSQEGEGEFTLTFETFGVDVGYPVKQQSILGDKTVPGYRVWSGQFVNNHGHEPDEVVDVDYCLTTSFNLAVNAALELVLKDAVDGWYESQMGDDFRVEVAYT